MPRIYFDLNPSDKFIGYRWEGRYFSGAMKVLELSLFRRMLAITFDFR